MGKSTLLNAMLGEKVAIVSNRPQTTRNRILGVMTRDKTQIVVVDTPGIHRKRSCINAFMVREALGSLESVDCVVMVTEVAPPGAKGATDPALDHEDSYTLAQIRGRVADVPLILAINKIDLARDRPRLLPLLDRWRHEGFSTIVPLSALKADGVNLLVDEVAACMPEGPHLYPEDMLTDRAERFLAAELIREQVFRQAHQEVPYSTAVEIERFEERADRHSVTIEAGIFVERDTQKAIVIGHNAQRIKEIGIRARDEIGRLLGCTVHLSLTVRVASDWSRSPGGRRRFGYE